MGQSWQMLGSLAATHALQCSLAHAQHRARSLRTSENQAANRKPNNKRTSIYTHIHMSICVYMYIHMYMYLDMYMYMCLA